MPTLVVDPNIVYVVLIVGLWVGVTAVYMPGTGVMEVLALAALGLGAYLLLSMPTNWVAVLLMVVGVLGFIIMPFIKQQWAMLAPVGLALQGLGGLMLFDGMSISPVVIAVMLVIPFMYHSFVLLPMLERIRAQGTVDKDELIIGMDGRVVKALDPVGTVNVNSELWTATSDEIVESGERVTVVDRDGLQLIVIRSKRKREMVNGHFENMPIE